MGLLDFFGFGSGATNLGSSLGSFIVDTGLGGLSSSLDSLGWTQHGRDQYFNRDMQREFLESQQNFQREMTTNQQDFTREMYSKQWSDMMQKYPTIMQKLGDVNFNLWRQQFDTQNDFNSYKNQISRMLGAGLNPNSLYGGGSSIASSSMSPLGTSAPPQISPTPFASHGSPIGLPQGFSYTKDNLRTIGGFLKDLASARQLGVQTDQLEKLFDYEVRERSERIFGMKLTNTAMGIANYVSDKTKDVKIRRETESLLNLIAQTQNLDADTGLKLEQKLTEKTKQLLNDSQRTLNADEHEILTMKVNTFMDEFRTRMENLRSDTQKNVSEARLNNALRETENQLRDGRVKAQSLGNQIMEIQKDLEQNKLFVDNATLMQQVDGIIWKLRREEFISNSAYEEWQQNKVKTEWASRQEFADYCTKFLGALAQVFGAAGSAASGVASYRNVDIQDYNMKERNRIADEFNKIYKQQVDAPQKAYRNSVLYGTPWAQ